MQINELHGAFLTVNHMRTDLLFIFFLPQFGLDF